MMHMLDKFSRTNLIPGRGLGVVNWERYLRSNEMAKQFSGRSEQGDRPNSMPAKSNYASSHGSAVRVHDGQPG